MKKLLFTILIGSLFTTLFISCEDYNDQFKGLDDLTKTTNVATYTYQLADADYATISKAALKAATNHNDTLKANSIKTNKAFSDNVLGSDYIPYLLPTKFPYGDLGSKVTVTYNYSQVKPTYLNDLTTINILSTENYQTVWGDPLVYVNAFTPAKPAATYIPALLAAKFNTATSGTYKFVEYNYSSTEAAPAMVDYKYFYEDFESHTCATTSPYTPISENGWIQIDTAGTKGKYNCRLYSSNKYAQVTSNGTSEKNDVFLITKQIDLTTADAPTFTFNVNVGYWNADCLTVLISSDFDGNISHISSATWTNLTSSFTLPQTPTNAYGTLASAGEADLSAYIGGKVYIAFKYTGDSRTATSPKVTTTYQIDNVKVSEMKAAISIPGYEKQYAVYKFDGSKWITPTTTDGIFIAPQGSDYTAMGQTYLSSANANLYLVNLLKQKRPYALEGEVVTVAYKSSSTTATYSAVKQYTFTKGEWVLNDFVVDQTAVFKLKEEGWVFYDADILVGLNPATGNNTTNLGAFSIVSVAGAEGWAWDSSYGMKMSGYATSNKDNEDWLISPAMNLTERLKPTLTFDHTGKYFGTMANEATLWVSTNYTEGLPSTATWTQVTIPTYMTGNDYNFVSSSEIDLSAYAGNSSVRIAFKYLSSTVAAGTWEVKNVYVFEKESK